MSYASNRDRLDYYSFLDSVDTSRSLKKTWNRSLEERYFAIFALVKSERASQDRLSAEHRNVLELFWKLPNDKRQTLRDEPLFCYVVNQLTECLVTRKLGEEELAQAIQILQGIVDRGLDDNDVNTPSSTTILGGVSLKSGGIYSELAKATLNKYSSNDTTENIAKLPLPDATNREIVTAFTAALDLLGDCARGYFDDVVTNTKVIVPIRTPYASGFSLSNFRGVVFITPESDVLDTIDHLVHENGHNKLDTLNDLYPLLEPMPEERFPSPWRKDLRPMEGLIHGAYVFTLVRYAMGEIYEKRRGIFSKSVENRIRRYRDQVDAAISTILQNARLTDCGREFIDALQQWHNKGPF